MDKVAKPVVNTEVISKAGSPAGPNNIPPHLQRAENQRMLPTAENTEGDKLHAQEVNVEPENQGVGSATSDMFSTHAVLGQWLVDLKRVSDDAFENTLGYDHEEVLTGMTSINGGTIEVNQVGESYWKQIGRACIDHYVTSGTYSSSLDTIITNSGGVPIYIGEYGTTGGVGSPANDAARKVMIDADFATFLSKPQIKGVCYWQAVGGDSSATERLLDDTSGYAIYPESFKAITAKFKLFEPSEFGMKRGVKIWP